MRFAFIGFFVIVLCSSAFAEKRTTTPSPCGKPCDGELEPICAKPSEGVTGKDLSFGSECVLDRYNCEHKTAQYVKKDDGECPGGQSIRLQ